MRKARIKLTIELLYGDVNVEFNSKDELCTWLSMAMITMRRKKIIRMIKLTIKLPNSEFDAKFNSINDLVTWLSLEKEASPWFMNEAVITRIRASSNVDDLTFDELEHIYELYKSMKEKKKQR